MKNYLFYGPKILGTVVLIGLLSALGFGNPKMLPFFALFFIALFAAIFFLNKMSQQKGRDAKAGGALGLGFRILGVLIFVAAVAGVGLGNGIVGYLLWLGIVILLVAAVYMLIKNHQRHFELTRSNEIVRYVLAGLFTVLAIVLPVLIMVFGKQYGQSETKLWLLLISSVGTLVFIGLICLASLFINKSKPDKFKQGLGYAAIILAGILPGVLTMPFNQSPQAFVGAYSAALVALVLSFFALDLGFKST